MVQLRPGLLISDAYGSAGQVTAYHRGGKCFLRKRVSRRPAGAGVSVATSVVHLRALQAWRSLPHEEQLRWEPYAREVEPHRPPFDHKAYISGNNLFISAYHGFATLGNEHIPSPAPFEPFPSFLVSILGASVEGETLYIYWRLEAEECQDVDDYLPFVVEIGQFLDNYVYPGAMRNFLAEGTANDARLTTCIPGYKSIWGLDLQSYQVYSRCILLDTETGYRSQFVAVSGIVEL